MDRHRLLVVLALAAAACSDDAGDTSDGPPATSPDGAAVEAVVSVEPALHSPIAAAVTVDATVPVKVSITAVAGDHVVEVPTTAVAAAVQVVPLVGMRQELTYDLEVEVADASGAPVDVVSESFTTGAVDFPLPAIDVVADVDRAQPGVTLIELNAQDPPPDLAAGQPVIGIDHEGEVVWWYRNTGTVGAIRPTDRGTLISQYFPLGIREIDLLGNVVANWAVAPEPPENPVEIRDADALAAIDELFGGNEGDPDPIPVSADWTDLTSVHHEAYPMPDGNVLALSTANHELTAEQRASFCPDDDVAWQATSDVIVEFDPDGTVLRTWDLWDVLDIDLIPGVHLCETEGNPFVSVDFRDWTHANAVVYDEGRDAILISSRHTDQIIALDHLDDLGAQSSVRWILGRDGTIPLDGEPPYHQHTIELQADGSILMNDNGNFRPGTSGDDATEAPYSRAVQYFVDDTAEDPADWTATQTWEHRMNDIDGQPLYARFLGDADRMPNGNVLITHGGVSPEDGFPHIRIVEVVPEGTDGGDIVWDLTIGTEEEPYVSYRAERLPSLYFGPAWEQRR